MTTKTKRAIAADALLSCGGDLEKFYSIVYQRALSDLAHEFESHDYFSQAGMVRGFARTSEWQVTEPKDAEVSGE